jgi:hypothetical protein
MDKAMKFLKNKVVEHTLTLILTAIICTGGFIFTTKISLSEITSTLNIHEKEIVYSKTEINTLKIRMNDKDVNDAEIKTDIKYIIKMLEELKADKK